MHFENITTVVSHFFKKQYETHAFTFTSDRHKMPRPDKERYEPVIVSHG